VIYPEGKTAGQSENLLRREYDDETGTCFLGDLFISVPHIIKQAAEYGHSEARESVYLLVHGICHLMGYDHMKPEEKEIMRKMEEKVISSMSAGISASSPVSDEQLLNYAKEAMRKSYSPYSGFPVGAALLTSTGKIYTGCNIENASFGLSNCAERTAVFKAVSEGEKQFEAIAITANAKAWPCGACRQVMNEFSPHMRVLVSWDKYVEEKNLDELLPENFGPDSMKK
jgi:homotetrameric cytidine deaminase/rRNA maturation RNase YbeY